MIRHIYIHIPFCHQICPYCAFYKHQPGALANRVFVEAILSEARIRAREFDVRPETIYFGGGTPSMLGKNHLRRLCEGLREIFDLSELREWTIESNPATFDLEKARLLRDLGITRPSLGVQSFQPATLTTLGRDHCPDDAVNAFSILRRAGFENISLDLMFSIPGQSLGDWEKDLETATDLDPDHLSCYNLTYEEDTEFMARHTAGELDASEDRDADSFYRAMDFLEGKGFEHYEISNYAKPGFQSVHNRAYWTGADYLGLGPSAVSTVKNRRWKTLPDTAAYIETIQSGDEVKCEEEDLSPEDRRIEAIALRLRTGDGVSEKFFSEASSIDSLIQQGLIVRVADRYCLTRKGKALADPIASALI